MYIYITVNVTANTTADAIADATAHTIAIIITENARHIYINIHAINYCILMQIDDSDSLN